MLCCKHILNNKWEYFLAALRIKTVPGDPKKYSCLIKRRKDMKREIFKNETFLDYQWANLNFSIDLFTMSSCIPTRWLVHNGGYIQKPLYFVNWSETLWFGRLYLVTEVLRNFSWIYHIKATIQCFELWKSAITDQSATFRKQVYIDFTHFCCYLTEIWISKVR